MQPTHYIEQFRENGKTKIVQTSPKEINFLQSSLNLTKSCNCKTIAVWKITPKPGIPVTVVDEINGQEITIIEEIKI